MIRLLNFFCVAFMGLAILALYYRAHEVTGAPFTFDIPTLLAVVPESVAMALTVRFEATRSGAWYCCDDAVGVEPSTV